MSPRVGGATLRFAKDSTVLAAGGKSRVRRTVVLRALKGSVAPLVLVFTLMATLPTLAHAADDVCQNVALRMAQGESGLPDCRAAELASPPAKNGADIAGSISRTRVSADGGAVQFSSLGAFGDARGTGIGTDYMAIRTASPGTSGWSTHALTPGNLEAGTIIDAVVVNFESRYMGEFTSELTAGVFVSNTPLTSGSPNTNELVNLYLRRDLRSAGAGGYQLVSDCPGCAGPLPANPSAKPFMAGRTPDFSHIIFESQEPLTSDTAPCTPVFFATACPLHLYEWTNGIVRLAGILPEAEGGGAADNSQAGQGASKGANYTPNTLSQDGRRIIFTVNTGGAVVAGKLYMRIDNGTPQARTVQINASERSIPDAVPADATFWNASTDGSKVIFSTNENLVDADNTGENNADLYLYDLNAAAGDHLTLLSPDEVGGGANVQGVIGASADGDTIYFIARAQLLSGLPTASDGYRIFRWQDGSLHHVAKVNFTALQGLLGFAGGGGWTRGQTARVTLDGRHLLFLTQGTDELSHTGVDDTCAGGACNELYLYDAAANGGQPDTAMHSDASFASSLYKGGQNLTSHLNHPLSDDGRYVFFDTGDRLLQDDQDATNRDVYEYDSATGQLYLLSRARPGSFGAIFVDASPSGSDAFVVTRDALTPWDRDDNVDLYDMRRDGGMLAPAAKAAACDADTCRPPQRGKTAVASPGSEAIVGDGNVTATHHRHRRCARGRVRRRVHGHVRCVKAMRHKAKRNVHHTKGR
jgi:Tol biopolymer transport system component